jgi:sugar phosphate isomerase/epimerase
MKIGTITLAFRRETLSLAEGEQYKFVSDMGLDCVDFSLSDPVTSPRWQLSDDELKAEMLRHKEWSEQYGVTICQTHSPYDFNLGYAWMDPEKRKEFWRVQVQAIKATSYLGTPYMVVHPLSVPGRMTEENYAKAKQHNIEFLQYLKPYLEEYDVKVAIENSPAKNAVLGRFERSNLSRAEDYIDYIDSMDSDRFVACLDIGHAYVSGDDPVDIIYKLGKKYLHVLHIHDNNLIRDEHMFPGSGKGDWYRIGKALNDIGFEGVFSFEVGNPYCLRFPEVEAGMLPILHRLYGELGRAITSVK